MYLQLFLLGPLHKKQRTLDYKPPSELEYVDGDKVIYNYHLNYSLNDGHKLIYIWREKNVPFDPDAAANP